MDTSPLWDWINERHAIWWRRNKTVEQCREALVQVNEPLLNAGYYTDDPILQQYRFCNVFRELDRVTIWIRENIRERYADHLNLWIMLAIARTINWPDTLDELINNYSEAWPRDGNWKPQYLADALEDIAEKGNKVYTGAYMIRAESDPKKEWYSWSKHRYIAEIVIGRLWEDRQMFEEYLDDCSLPEGVTLEGMWGSLQGKRYIGWGPFMAYQVVVDMRWTRYLKDADDINHWAALGPGSRRGLNRLAGRPVDYPLKQEDGLKEMEQLWIHQHQHRAFWVPPIDLSDIQNALCETDKYLRVKNGEGKPRALYHPGRGY